MTPAHAAEDRLLALLADGQTLLERERTELLAGRFDGLEGIAGAKAELLDRLERLIPQSRGTGPVRDALDGLIRESRRNERLIGAALSGVRSARRSISAILATRRGDVAYAADGSRITSRDDAVQKSSRA